MGSEIWGVRGGSGVIRLDKDRNTLDQFDPVPGLATQSLIQVGSEVWISANTSTQVFRTDLSGNTLPSFSMPTGGSGYVSDWAAVGAEIWGMRGSGVTRFDASGNSLGEFDPVPGLATQSVIQVGSEVWISANTSTQVFRTDLSGNTLLSFPMPDGGTGYVSDWAAVGAEIWGVRGSGVIRFDTDGNILGEFDPVPGRAANSLVAVPEPSSALLMALGFAGLATRRIQ